MRFSSSGFKTDYFLIDGIAALALTSLRKYVEILSLEAIMSLSIMSIPVVMYHV